MFSGFFYTYCVNIESMKIGKILMEMLSYRRKFNTVILPNIQEPSFKQIMLCFMVEPQKECYDQYKNECPE